MIYLLTADRQNVITYSTIHALELFFSDSNTQNMINYSTIHALELFYSDSNTLKHSTKMPLIPSDSPNLPALLNESPPSSQVVTHAFMSNCNVFVAGENNNKPLHSLTSRKRLRISGILLKTSRNGGFSRHALPPTELLQIKVQFISVAHKRVMS